MTESSPATVILFCVLVSAVSCSAGDKPVGTGPVTTIVISSAAEADILFPPLVHTSQGMQVTDQIFERLADLKDRGSTAGSQDFVPRLAATWEWGRDSLSITFHINPAAKWHDGAPVRAADVAFTFSLYRDSTVYDGAANFAAIDSVSTPDSATTVFWFAARSPEQFYTATHDMRILPEHLLVAVARNDLATSPFVRRPIGSGPFRFLRWGGEPNVVLELAADTNNYLGRPAVDRVVFSASGDYNAAATKVMNGGADFAEVLHPAMEELLRNPGVRAVTYPTREYAFIAFNFRERLGGSRPHPILSDRGVRAAIALALNRESLVRTVFDSLANVAFGPFVRSMSTADTTLRQIPFDPMRASYILDSLGWRIPPSGEFRVRGMRRLEFGLLVPNTSQARQRAALLAKAELHKIGVSLVIEDADYPTYAARVAAHDFDTYFGTHLTTPSPAGLRDEWSGRTSAGAGTLNHGYYENRVMTAITDSALGEFNATRRQGYFRRAYQMATDDVAAIWMYEPRQSAAVNARLHIPALSAYAWWSRFREWRVDPAAPSQRQ